MNSPGRNVSGYEMNDSPNREVKPGDINRTISPAPRQEQGKAALQVEGHPVFIGRAKEARHSGIKIPCFHSLVQRIPLGTCWGRVAQVASGMVCGGTVTPGAAPTNVLIAKIVNPCRSGLYPGLPMFDSYEVGRR